MKSFVRAGGTLALICICGHAALAEDKTPPAAAPAAAAPVVIYDTALQAGWQNWSWAKTELSIEVGGSARKPIKVEAGPWQALYLHHDGFNTAGYVKLHMLIQGSAPDGQVRVFALMGGKPVGEGKPLTISNTGWTRVVTPLATLGVEDQTIDGIWVQNATAGDLPKFFVTEIRLE